MIVATRPETENDRQAVRKINQAAFASAAEAGLVDALREGEFVKVSLVAESDGQVVGHVLFSRLQIITASGTLEALALAPMAVLPEHQRQGIGSKLVQAGLETCRKQGHRIVVVLGHPAFYRRFGFSSELAEPLISPFGGGEAWMAVELVPGALQGVEGRIDYPPPFRRFE